MSDDNDWADAAGDKIERLPSFMVDVFYDEICEDEKLAGITIKKWASYCDFLIEEAERRALRLQLRKPRRLVYLGLSNTLPI